ncbi:DUF4190 domain-containing protein [Streptomyces sp. NPDC051207]|uniref:DUF4190 domain-containing protein n=1 Tax=Streptomyces sp. NPDC051207 TaxID=3154641 RepID=UPI0034429543
MSTPPPPGPFQPPQGPYPPPAPHPGGPYGSWGPVPGPHGARAAVNGLAVGALVLGVLCFLPAVGLVLGLIALRQIRRRGERGRGMAIAGAVLSAAGLALWTAALTTGAVSDAWQGFKEGVPGSSTFALDKGDCFESPGGMEGMTYDVDPVPCAGGHDGEVFAVVTLPGGSYPGEGSLTDTADDKCYALQDTYAMDGWAVPDHVDVYYLMPTEDSWRFGDQEITCVFGHTEEKGSLTGSLRSDESTLDSHQVAYLKAVRVLDTAMDTAPEEEYVEDDLPSHREWADRVAGALTEQVGLLRGHDWPSGARQPVAGLVKDLEAAQEEWAKAGRAADADTFYDHYDEALELTDPQRSVTARKALGLATTPPAHEESGGEEGEGSGLEV